MQNSRVHKFVILALAAAALAVPGAAQQTIAPFSTPYGDFTQGIQLDGSYGTLGNCLLSTGTGTDFGGCNANLMQLVTPPTTGQYVIVYAGSSARATTGFPIPPPTAGISGGFINNQSIGLTGTGEGTVTLSAPTLPSYVLPANITAVYAFAIASSAAEVPPGGDTCDSGPYTRNGSFVGSVTVTGTGIGSTTVVSGNEDGFDLGQYTTAALGISGTNFSTLTTTLYYSTSGHCYGSAYLNVPLTGYFVYYTGTAPPANTALTVVPPLEYSEYSNTLSIDPEAEFAGTSIVPSVVSALPIPSSDAGSLFLVSDGPDCAAGGGSTYTLCQSDGTAYVAFGGTGVTAWSGDGMLFSNLASTGGVTATLGLAGAYKVWANCTASTATPTYCALVDAMLPTQGSVTPGNYTNSNITVNAQGIITGISNGSGGGGGLLTINTKITAYIALSGDLGAIIQMNASGAETVTLPVSFPTGFNLWVKNVGAGPCTVQAASGNIDNNASFVLNQWQAAQFYWDGSVWRVLSESLAV